jgi:hypothetical protein
MRSFTKLGFVLVLLIAPCLASSEILESFNLCDDTSNDFVSVNPTPKAKAEEVEHRIQASHLDIVLNKETPRNLSGRPSIELSPTSGPDLLRLLSIQRK